MVRMRGEAEGVWGQRVVSWRVEVVDGVVVLGGAGGGFVVGSTVGMDGVIVVEIEGAAVVGLGSSEGEVGGGGGGEDLVVVLEVDVGGAGKEGSVVDDEEMVSFVGSGLGAVEEVWCGGLDNVAAGDGDCDGAEEEEEEKEEDEEVAADDDDDDGLVCSSVGVTVVTLCTKVSIVLVTVTVESGHRDTVVIIVGTRLSTHVLQSLCMVKVEISILVFVKYTISVLTFVHDLLGAQFLSVTVDT